MEHHQSSSQSIIPRLQKYAPRRNKSCARDLDSSLTNLWVLGGVPLLGWVALGRNINPQLQLAIPVGVCEAKGGHPWQLSTCP